MPTKNVTIDNICPLINYSPVGAWQEGDGNDPNSANYSGTFTFSVNSGATATLSFNGTGIWLFGAKRSDHGLYNVTLDGHTSTLNGYAADPGIFQAPLFTQTNLENTLHTITLTNAGTDPNHLSDYLDLDFITWESTFGTDYEEANETTIQDSDPSFSYQPEGSWNTNPQFLNSFLGQSGHATSSAGASATFTFAGDVVQIFGTSGPNDAPYSVQLDGGSSLTFNATKLEAHEQVLLYYADNLGPGSHNVKIVNQPALSGQSLNINYALVDSVPSAPTSTANGLSRVAIAGVGIGAFAVIVIVVGIYFLWRRRVAQMRDKFGPQPFTGVSLAEQADDTHSLASLSRHPLNHNKESYDGNSSRWQPQYGHDHRPVSVTSAGQPNDPYATQNRGSTSVHRSSQTSLSQLSALSNPNQLSTLGGDPFSGRSLDLSVTDTAPSGTRHAQRKGAPVQLPSTAGQLFIQISPVDLLVNRMNVQGRPQDLGHVPVEGEMPPPNYDQATEP